MEGEMIAACARSLQAARAHSAPLSCRHLGILAALTGTLVLGLCVAASAHPISADRQVRQAWERFRVAYVDRSAKAMCSMLTPAAQAELEAQTGERGCVTAADRWFRAAQFDRPAAVKARVIGVEVSGQTAQVLDTDPNDPAVFWVEHRGSWMIASFIPLG